jgi:predicted phage terminase large subunit-like protein
MLINQSLTALQDYWNQRAQNDLAIFTERLGYENAPFHLEWYDFLQHKFNPLRQHPDAVKQYLLLWPRGHAKTECTTINYVSWLVGKYPDIHVNIVTKTSSLSEEILTALMTRFESDERYREIFGELKPANARKWTSHELIVDRHEISKNPTLKATGLMGPITGGRSDLVVCDDIIDEENVRTPLQLEKVSTWFHKVLYPTLYPWGGIIAIGTRWSYADIYTELLQKWPHDVKQAIQADGSALWPNYWSLEKLEQRRNEIGTIFFDCQYQNDPTSMEGSLLKAKWLQPWDELPPAHLPNYAGVDPSLGESDYFGIATLAYDHVKHQGYLKDVWCEHQPLPVILKEVFPQLNQKYNYKKVYMETNFWQKLLIKLPELKGYPIVPINTVKNKEERFIPLSSHFESGRILVNPLLLNKSEFWTEWVQFPRGQHDDALDCVELVVQNFFMHLGPIETDNVNVDW